MKTLSRVLLLWMLVLAPVAFASANLEGRWRLVQQHYGEGEANQAIADLPIRLEFLRDRGNLVGRVRIGEAEAPARDWPALEIAGETRTVLLQERRFDETTGEVLARYRLQPAPGDGLVLEITERYRLGGDGQSLVGTVEVDFMRDGERRGGYVLRRRFAREP